MHIQSRTYRIQIFRIIFSVLKPHDLQTTRKSRYSSCRITINVLFSNIDFWSSEKREFLFIHFDNISRCYLVCEQQNTTRRMINTYIILRPVLIQNTSGLLLECLKICGVHNIANIDEFWQISSLSSSNVFTYYIYF